MTVAKWIRMKFFLGDNTKWRMMIVPSRSSNQTTESTLAIICVIKRSKNRDLISREVNTCFKSSFMVDYNRHLKFSKLQKKKLNGFVVYWSCLPFFFPRHSTFCGLWQLLMLNGTAIDKWNWRNKKNKLIHDILVNCDTTTIANKNIENGQK